MQKLLETLVAFVVRHMGQADHITSNFLKAVFF